LLWRRALLSDQMLLTACPYQATPRGRSAALRLRCGTENVLVRWEHDDAFRAGSARRIAHVSRQIALSGGKVGRVGVEVSVQE
jgi:hypothetical protein